MNTHTPYRIAARKLLLTYNDTTMPLQHVWDHLFPILQKTKQNGAEKYLLVKERRESGKIDLHVFIKLNYKLDTRNRKFFDIEYNDSIYNGEYQPCTSEKRTIQSLLEKSNQEDRLTNLWLDSNDQILSLDEYCLELVRTEGIPSARDFYLEYATWEEIEENFNKNLEAWTNYAEALSKDKEKE